MKTTVSNRKGGREFENYRLLTGREVESLKTIDSNWKGGREQVEGSVIFFVNESPIIIT